MVKLLISAWSILSLAAFGGDLDLNNPDDAVRASRKLYASLKDGEPHVYYWEGRIWGRRPGERDKLLFSYIAMNIRACKTVSSDESGYGYDMVSRELLFYMDPQTGEILDQWKNPYTGDTVAVMHVANDPVNHGQRAKSRWGAAKWRGTFKGDIGWLMFEIPLFYDNPLGGEYQKYVGNKYQAMEAFNFFFDKAQLLDGGRDSVDDVIISWSRTSQWLPWMEMGGRHGMMIYNGGGKKLGSWDELPALMKEKIKKDYPAWTEPPPLDDQRQNVTSWRAFKRLIDAKGDDADKQ